MIEISRKFGRVIINLTAIEMGKDLCVVLTGGEAHLGAVTVGSGTSGHGTSDHRTSVLETISLPTHKEHVVTEMLGKILKEKFSGNFIVCCGIHLDDITSQEIKAVVDMCKDMGEELCSILN